MYKLRGSPVSTSYLNHYYQKRRTHPTIFPFLGLNLFVLFKEKIKKSNPCHFLWFFKMKYTHGSQLEFILDLSLPASQPRHHLAISDPKERILGAFRGDKMPCRCFSKPHFWQVKSPSEQLEEPKVGKGEIHPHLRNLSTSHWCNPQRCCEKKHHKNWS